MLCYKALQNFLLFSNCVYDRKSFLTTHAKAGSIAGEFII